MGNIFAFDDDIDTSSSSVESNKRNKNTNNINNKNNKNTNNRTATNSKQNNIYNNKNDALHWIYLNFDIIQKNYNITIRWACENSQEEVANLLLDNKNVFEQNDENVQHLENLSDNFINVNYNNISTKKYEKKCIVCMEEVINIAILECGHLCCCEKCSSLLGTSNNPICPICRKAISGFKKIYFV